MSDTAAAIADEFTRGTQLLRAGRCEEALVVFRAVYAHAQQAGQSDMMAASLCEIGWSCHRCGDSERGLECAMGARWLWARLGNKLEVARAMAVQSVLFLDLGFPEEAFDLSSEAVEFARAEGEQAVLAFALNAKGIVLAVSGEAELGAEQVEQAIAIANEQKNTGAIAYYLLNLGFCHAKLAAQAGTLGDAARAMAEREIAIEINDGAIALAQHSGDLWTLRVALGNNAEALALQGRHDAALSLLDRCGKLPDKPDISLRIHFRYTLGDVLFRAGRIEDALGFAIEAVALADTTELVELQLNAVGKLAEILEVHGDAPAALALFKRFHSLHVRQSGEASKRRARIESIRSETDFWRNRAATLADQAMSDQLTGIANRRSFDQTVDQLAGTAFCVAIVDLDNFKSVNDRFSHIVGDAVLKRVARILIDQVGAHGHAARLGGEEFALVFPEVPEAAAALLCQGVRIAVSSADWSDLGKGLEVTVSIGLASGTGEQPAGLLIQMADNRLYAAKANGRDCVVFSDALDAAVTPSPAERQKARA